MHINVSLAGDNYYQNVPCQIRCAHLFFIKIYCELIILCKYFYNIICVYLNFLIIRRYIDILKI